MRITFVVLRFFTLLLILVPVLRANTLEDNRKIMRNALENMKRGEKQLEDYLFRNRIDRKEFDSSGKQTSHTSLHLLREELEGFIVTRAIEKDGKPIPEAERKANEDKIRKRIAELKSMPADKRKAEKKKDDDEDQWITEFPEALDFKLVGEESREGRTLLVMDCYPRPGYQPKNMQARVFEKMKGRVWVDKTDQELAKAEAEVFDTVNIGFGVLGRVEKGTRFSLSRKPIAEKLWAADSQGFKFNARVMMFKHMNQEIRIQSSDYKKRTQPSHFSRVKTSNP